MKLHLNTTNKAESDKVIEAIKKVLDYKDKYIHEEENCDLTVDSFVGYATNNYDAVIEKIALHAYGNALLGTVRHLEGLRFIGDGYCPKCGSNRIETDIDFLELARCQRCLQVFEPKRYLLTYNGINYWQ